MKIEELAEFPHAAIVSEYSIDVKKLPVPLKAKVQNVNKSIQALTDESTEDEINEVLDQSTLVAGLLIDEFVPKEEVKAAKKLSTKTKTALEKTIEEEAEAESEAEEDESEEDSEQEEEEEVVAEPKKTPSTKKETAPNAAEKIQKIVAICKEKGSITVDQLKELGLKQLADTIELDKDNTIEKKGEVYVLKGSEEKKGDGIVGTLLAIAGAAGLVFGLHKLFSKK